MPEEKAFVKNAADAKQVKNASEKIKSLKERDLGDVRWIVSTPQGRRFYWKYLKSCHVFETSFTGNSHTFFNEGERNVGLRLLAELNDADPEAYMKMLLEAKDETIKQVEPETQKEE